MVGIYKITNKINNKSYIGQSIHCGKRLDEHYKGSQFIDSVIQLEGIQNFKFEILKEIEKEDLSYWEDYYIMKYDTMFPNGYNKKWNCGKEVRTLIKKELEKEKTFSRYNNYMTFPNSVEFLKNARENDFKIKVAVPSIEYETKYKKLTNKQRIIYFYLMSICYQNDFEEFYYIYKDRLNVSQASKLLNVSRATFYSALEALKKYDILEEKDKYYIIQIPKVYTIIDQETLKFLLSYQIYIGVDLIRIYIALSYMLLKSKGEVVTFTKRKLIKLLGRCEHDNISYQIIELCLSVLKYQDLINVYWQTKTCELGEYKEFLLMGVNKVKESKTINIEMIIGNNKKEIFEQIKKEINNVSF